MIETGARPTSLLSKKDSTHDGLLIEDVSFILLADGARIGRNNIDERKAIERR
jgi:hypothetical protein